MCNIYNKTKGLFINLIANDNNPDLKQDGLDYSSTLVEEARIAGLTILGPSEMGYYGTLSYQFDVCGHKRDVGVKEVRKNNVICSECQQNKMISDMLENGLVYLSPAPPTPAGATKKFFMYSKCGHTDSGLRAHLTTKGKECRNCNFAKTAKKLKQNSMTLLGIQSKTKALIVFDNCGHEGIVWTTAARSGHPVCHICRLARWKEEAREVGLEYLGSISGRDHVYLARCGHEIINKPANLKITGHWTCRTCNAGFKKFRSFLYLFKMKHGGFEWVKLGFGKSPDRRRSDYKLADGVEFSLISKVEVENGTVAEHLERILHRKYKPFNIDKKLMKQYMTESGFTETYPASFLEDLKFELEVCEGMTQTALDSILTETQ